LRGWPSGVGDELRPERRAADADHEEIFEFALRPADFAECTPVVNDTMRARHR